jgi:hypothetical protein
MSVKEQPKFTAAVLEAQKKKADYGVLAQLEGTWANHNPNDCKGAGFAGFGIHTTMMPSPGTNSEQQPAQMHFLCENYTEELTFTLVKGGVRNRGGANEQFTGAVKYSQSISNEKGEGIHEENGMYLHLDNMYNHAASKESIETDLNDPEMSPGDGSKGPIFVPAHTIARSGTIPHGSTIQLLGSDQLFEGEKPTFPEGVATWDIDSDHLAISPSMGGGDLKPINLDEERPEWVLNECHELSDEQAYNKRILAHALYPYSVRPDLRLRDVIKDQNIKDFSRITMGTEFDSGQGPQGGILNTPMVQRYTPVKKMSHTMWIETVIEDGKEIQQLQYEQVMGFAFGFRNTGTLTIWPHIQVNTLRKKD